ncbi:hypothetical protein DFH27DRAFT_369954 [Peziza echinospora]|nr:hypothetical protein DFH27DRAFT_369954 [Peziza echinospora]
MLACYSFTNTQLLPTLQTSILASLRNSNKHNNAKRANGVYKASMDSNTKKHAACDECRGRKLKCSGNRRGCDRCVRDGAVCYYSAQKRMGRPRKLRCPPKIDNKQQSESHFSASTFNSPEPVPSFKNPQFCVHHENMLGSDWLELADFTVPSSQSTHAPSVFSLDWDIREQPVCSDSPASNSTSAAYEIASILAPIPTAPIPAHLLAPDIHHHLNAPRFQISNCTSNVRIPFDLPSPPFTAPNNGMLGHSPPLPPAPPVSTAGNSPHAQQNLNLHQNLGSSSPQYGCECLFNLFLSITLLKTHLMKNPIPFQLAISTSRSAISTASLSLSCPSCQISTPGNRSGNNGDCMSDMFLGALLPMLCTFYSKALESIEVTTGEQKVQIDGQGVAEMGLEEWKEMARGAMRNEATRVDALVEEMERISMKRHGMVGGALCNAAGTLWEPLCFKMINITGGRKDVLRSFSETMGR